MGLETPAWSPPGSNFSSSRSVTARRADGRWRRSIPHYPLTSLTLLSSVQFKMVRSMRSERPVFAPSRLQCFPSIAFEVVPVSVWQWPSDVFPLLPMKRSNVRLIGDGPLSPFQGRSSSASSFHASLLQKIDGLMSLALCPRFHRTVPREWLFVELMIVRWGPWRWVRGCRADVKSTTGRGLKRQPSTVCSVTALDVYQRVTQRARYFSLSHQLNQGFNAVYPFSVLGF